MTEDNKRALIKGYVSAWVRWLSVEEMHRIRATCSANYGAPAEERAARILADMALSLGAAMTEAEIDNISAALE